MAQPSDDASQEPPRMPEKFFKAKDELARTYCMVGKLVLLDSRGRVGLLSVDGIVARNAAAPLGARIVECARAALKLAKNKQSRSPYSQELPSS